MNWHEKPIVEIPMNTFETAQQDITPLLRSQLSSIKLTETVGVLFLYIERLL